ncbi:chloride channel protein [Capsulimonas corticalis]|uniref:Chloride channel protein n=1 Tax=Capsulimonas corticalis TaxID=2219043 RepID=A0A402D3H1_9BACT|nr:VWA domain-containing protein [Capsulimonas corticalis]BDI31866.1 chloride channel protein [Capsulimonas corticalis]
MLTFQDPRIFSLVPLVILVLIWAARLGYSGLRRHALWFTAALRTLTLIGILAALAGTAYVGQSDRLCVIFVVDVSRSMTPELRARAWRYLQSALATKRPSDVAGVVVFARDARAAAAPSTLVEQIHSLRSGGVVKDATDLEHALRLALALFPPDRAKKIVLLSDGNETAGNVASLEPALQANHIAVDVADIFPSDKFLPPEALLKPLALASRVAVRTPFAIPVHAWSSRAQAATLSLGVDGRFAERRAVHLPAGDSAWEFTRTMTRPGSQRFDVSLSTPSDTIPSNNAVYATVRAAGSARVLYLTMDRVAGVGLRELLARDGIEIVVRSPVNSPDTLEDLSQFDGVVVGDVTAQELGASAMLAIQNAVHDEGIGLGMIGGERGFAGGGYAGTPMEPALPVEMDRKGDTRTPRAAIVVALDASGSMAQLEDGVQKLQLGAKAAVQLMHALKPDDQIAVTAVREQTQVVLPLQTAANTQPLEDTIDALSAGGGGIYCRTALEDADAILQRSDAPVRHVILVADTGDSEQPEGCIALARRMKAAGVTVSVCGIGGETDKDAAFQRALASAGGGQSLIVEEAEQLPALFVRDAQHLQTKLSLERRVALAASAGAPMLAGLPLDTIPPVLGYDFIRAKTGAGVALATADSREPILAYGHFGEARTFAFASDGAEHWTASWSGWRGRRAFWAQLLRWFAKGDTDGGANLHVDEQDGAGRVTVTAKNDADARDWQAFVTSPHGVRAPMTLSPMDARSAEGRFPLDQIGGYSVGISHRSGAPGSKTAQFVVPYSPEFLEARPDRPRLIRLASEARGVYAQPAGRVFRGQTLWVTAERDLTPWLLLFSAFCFLGELVWRARGLRASK